MRGGNGFYWCEAWNCLLAPVTGHCHARRRFFGMTRNLWGSKRRYRKTKILRWILCTTLTFQEGAGSRNYFRVSSVLVFLWMEFRDTLPSRTLSGRASHIYWWYQVEIAQWILTFFLALSDQKGLNNFARVIVYAFQIIYSFAVNTHNHKYVQVDLSNVRANRIPQLLWLIRILPSSSNRRTQSFVDSLNLNDAYPQIKAPILPFAHPNWTIHILQEFAKVPFVICHLQ